MCTHSTPSPFVEGCEACCKVEGAGWVCKLLLPGQESRDNIGKAGCSNNRVT